MKREVDCRSEARRAPAHWPQPSGSGRLRSYLDVRATFAPWRRLALFAWAERERSRAGLGRRA